MEEEFSNFNYNACSISVKVVGGQSHGSGFLYITPPSCKYNYILTARHIFQEGSASPKIENLSDLTIKRCVDKAIPQPLKILPADYKYRLYFSNKADLAIIKIDKEWLPKAKRIFVRNIQNVKNQALCQSASFPEMSREERVILSYKVIDNELFNLRLCEDSKVANWELLKAISGSGIYLQEDPYLIGIVSFYRLPKFGIDEIKVSEVNWNEVNAELKNIGWLQLEVEESKYTIISDNQDVINVGEVEINGLPLNLGKGIEDLRHDLRDDWFFDPLHYADMCNNSFVLNYFSNKERRSNYKAAEMSVAYIPKKSLVLRKAMIGSFVDRLVYTSVMDIIGPVIERNLSPYVFSARYNKNGTYSGLIVSGVEQWIKMNYLVKDWTAKKKGCLVKVDLLNYYDTINKEILVRLLTEVACSDIEKKAVCFLREFLASIDSSENKNGLPQNCDASSLLATFYVSHIDEFMLSRVDHYCRFMDDIYFVASDVFQARNLLQIMEKELRAIGLSLNAQKVQFINLERQQETECFEKDLYTFDYNKQLITLLLRSKQKARRMAAMAKLVKEIHQALFTDGNSEQADRSLKFCLHTLCTSRINLYTYWNDFLESLEKLVDKQEQEPAITPLLCRIIASLSKSRDITDIMNKLAESLIKGHFTYEWQTYNIWLLLAYLKFQTPKLVRYATSQIDSNDETRRIEVAAIMIYMVTIRPKYNRIILHKLRNGLMHGYFQKRCALIACRNIEKEAIDSTIIEKLPCNLQTSHRFLNKHKDKNLVYFHTISSVVVENNPNMLFPEYYSGL